VTFYTYAIKVVKGLGPIDARTVGRDSLLRGMIALPLVIGVLARFAVPILMRRIGEVLAFDLQAYHAPIMSSALLLIAPATCGLAVGLMLLDQRDDRTLMALQVTPLPLKSYLAYRLAAPMLVSLGMTVVAFPIAGLASAGMVAVLLAALTAAPLAPLVALGLAAFAENKVQGLALLKGASVVLAAPLVALFAPAGWQWAFGAAPTYWPARLYWALGAGAPDWWVYLAAGLAYQGLLLVLVLRRFNRVMWQ
jgi:fluoroquinolone transport system permease protein